MSGSSKQAMEWREEYYKKYPPIVEGKKRCSICKELKYFNTEQRDISEFHIRKNQAYKMREAGYEHAVYLRPDSWCKKCKNEENRQRSLRRRKANPIAERERKREMHLKHRERIGEEAYLAKKREWSKAYRRRRGIGLGNDVDDRKEKSGLLVDTRPFVNWIFDTWPDGGGYTAVKNCGVPNAEKISRIMNGSRTKVDPEWVDMVLTNFNGPHLSQLYPELYNN